jgi:ArsR family transcriptional regulator, arsenate/arsenite/antimonite-responsive transcriptional repressor
MRLKHFNLTFGTQIFQSFADEARTRILHLLYRKNELTISDLVTILDFTQTKTSRHMTYLKNAGLVNARKQDQWVFYSIREEGFDVIKQIFEFLDKDPVLQKDLQAYETMASNRELAVKKLEAKDYRR